MLIRRRDDRLAGAKAIGQRARRHLGLVQIGRDVNIAHRDEAEQRCLVDELIEEGDMFVYAELSRPQDEALAVRLALLSDEVRMCRAQHDIYGVWPAAEGRRHLVDDIFDPLVWGKQA